MSLEEATIQQVQAYYEKADKKWEIDKTEREKEKSYTPQTAVTQTKLGQIVSSLTKPFQSLKNQINCLKKLIMENF